MQRAIIPLTLLLMLCISLLFVRSETTAPASGIDADAIGHATTRPISQYAYFATPSALDTSAVTPSPLTVPADYGSRSAHSAATQQARSDTAPANRAAVATLLRTPRSDQPSPSSTIQSLALEQDHLETTPTPTALDARLAERFDLPARYFHETGHNVWGAFLTFYNINGGVHIFGLPLTEPLYEDGVLVQYFERTRLEIDPNNPEQVRSTPLGVRLAEYEANQTALQRQDPSVSPNSIYIQRTGHTIDHWFHTFWQRHGGSATFGDPISEAFIEMRMPKGQPYRIQYFERARLEAPLDQRGYAQEISLAHIGQEYLDMVAFPSALREPALPIRMLGSSTVFVGSSATGSVQNVRLATHKLNGWFVPAGQVGSFLAGIGDVSVQAGYTAGAAIVDGKVVDELGGGICYVSTLLYRAALNAGLEIIERSPHSLALREFSDMPGLDAAVFTPSMDLRLRNDTPGPLLIVSEITTDGEIVIRIWGYDDGRTTTLSTPAIHYYEGDDAAIWRYDETLPEDTIEQIGYSAPGMYVTVERVVTGQDNQVLHYDQITSSYAPWQDIFLYGPGIDPECEQDEGQEREACKEYHQERQCQEDPASCTEQDTTDDAADTGSDAEAPAPPPTPATTPTMLPTSTPAPSPATLPTAVQNEGAPPPSQNEGAPPPQTQEPAPIEEAIPASPPEGAPPPEEPAPLPAAEEAAPAPPQNQNTSPMPDEEGASSESLAPPATPTTEYSPANGIEGAPPTPPAPIPDDGVVIE